MDNYFKSTLESFRKMPKEEVKQNIIRGFNKGLFAFVISFVIAFIIAVGVNVSLLEHLSTLLQGSIGKELNFSLANVFRVTDIVLNIAVFNSINGIRVGILIFAIMPIIAFVLSNKFEKTYLLSGVNNGIIILSSSLIYSVLIIGFAFIVKGNFIGVMVNFADINNLVNTFLITAIIQIQLYWFSKKEVSKIVKASRFTIGISVLISLTVSIVYIVILLKDISVNVFIKIAAAIGLLPNLITYEIVKNMGIHIEMSETIYKLFNKVDININYSPLAIRVVFMIIMISLIGFSMYRFDIKHYIESTIIYGLLVSLSFAFLAYCTRINLGGYSFVGDLGFGIDIYMTFYMTFFYILIVALFVYMLRQIIRIIADDY